MVVLKTHYVLGRLTTQDRSPPQAVDVAQSSALWHRAIWRHNETVGHTRVGHMCMRTPDTVNAACGCIMCDTQGPLWFCWSPPPICGN